MTDKKPEEIKEEKPASAEATTGGKELQKKLEESEKKAAEYLAGWQRARADLLNYKKEEMERIGELLKYANEEFVLRILPILDNFEIVEKKIADNLKNDENIKGMLLVKKQIQDFLKSQKVEEVKSAGEKFNPSLHEAVEEIEMKDGEKSMIVEEVQRGYQINGRLIRPAKVKIIK